MHEVARYLCSDLVTLRTEAGESVVNLEEIWTSGAVFDCEDTIAVGASIEMLGGAFRFHGSVSSADFHDFGCRVEVAFSPLTPWSPERFTPRHLLDPDGLKAD